jgi:hypothetical protein
MAKTTPAQPTATEQRQAASAEALALGQTMHELQSIQHELLLAAASAEGVARIGYLTQPELQGAIRKKIVAGRRSSGANNERIYTVVVPATPEGAPFHFGYFLAPDRHALAQCIGKNKVLQTEVLFNECFVAGSPDLQHKDDLFMAVVEILPSLIQSQVAALHDGFFDPASRSAGSSSSMPSSDSTSTSTPALFPTPTSN